MRNESIDDEKSKESRNKFCEIKTISLEKSFICGIKSQSEGENEWSVILVVHHFIKQQTLLDQNLVYLDKHNQIVECIQKHNKHQLVSLHHDFYQEPNKPENLKEIMGISPKR